MYLDLSQGFRSGINGSPTFVPDLSCGPCSFERFDQYLLLVRDFLFFSGLLDV